MAAVEDRRVDRTKAHDLQDILVLSVPVVLAVLCGTDGWEYIELFADGGGDYVLARNRGQSPHDRAMLQWSRDLEVAERSQDRVRGSCSSRRFNGAATWKSRKGRRIESEGLAVVVASMGPRLGSRGKAIEPESLSASQRGDCPQFRVIPLLR